MISIPVAMRHKDGADVEADIRFRVVDARDAPTALIQTVEGRRRRWFVHHDGTFWKPVARADHPIRLLDLRLQLGIRGAFRDPYDWRQPRTPEQVDPESDLGRDLKAMVDHIETDCIVVNGVIYGRVEEPCLGVSIRKGGFLSRLIAVPGVDADSHGLETPTETMFSFASAAIAQEFLERLSGARRTPGIDIEIIMPEAFVRDEERHFAAGARSWICGIIPNRALASAPIPLVRALRAFVRDRTPGPGHIVHIADIVGLNRDCPVRAAKAWDGQEDPGDPGEVLRRTLPLALRRACLQFPDSAFPTRDVPELDDLVL